MNDNEIIKALECCKTEAHCDEGCPYYSKAFKENLSCLDEEKGLIPMALDLITRQKADLKQKDTEIDILIRKNETLKDEVAGLKAEVERLKNECFCLSNERDAYKDVLDTAVSEARKEFAERLKCGVPRETGVIRCADIDNLLAEMESERG